MLYQITAATIQTNEIREGSHQYVEVAANNIGIFDNGTNSLTEYRWIPSPGAVVRTAERRQGASSVPTSWMKLGSVLGTNIPIYLDLDRATEGHLAILGMTKMGKTTLAERLTKRLQADRRVAVLDVTGEWVNKKGFTAAKNGDDWTAPKTTVVETKSGQIPAAIALKFFKRLLDDYSIPEYSSGSIVKRSIVVDEAHQFIPEPAGIGFGAPGRDQSIELGLLMMQIRKYGLSVVLISQRTAVVAKSALSQCENLIAFRNVDQTGLDYLEAIAGNEVRKTLPRLKQGQALVVGPAMSAETPVVIDVDQ